MAVRLADLGRGHEAPLAGGGSHNVEDACVNLVLADAIDELAAVLRTATDAVIVRIPPVPTCPRHHNLAHLTAPLSPWHDPDKRRCHLVQQRAIFFDLCHLRDFAVLQDACVASTTSRPQTNTTQRPSMSHGKH